MPMLGSGFQQNTYTYKPSNRSEPKRKPWQKGATCWEDGNLQTLRYWRAAPPVSWSLPPYTVSGAWRTPPKCPCSCLSNIAVTFLSLHVCRHTFINTNTPACSCTHIHIPTHMYTSHKHNIYMGMHTYIYLHTDIYTYTNAHRQTLCTHIPNIYSWAHT